MPITAQDALGYFQTSGYRILSIAPEHAIAVSEFPSHHHDPFDRMIVAQELVEPLHLMTHDALVQLYSQTNIRIGAHLASNQQCASD